MKFEYNKDKFAELGLIVKHGNCQNIVFFWDETEQAASYIVEIYRYVGDTQLSRGFMNDSDVYLTVKQGKAKPVCAITVERNKFYHSVNDLPCGDYIVCLKVEDRSGEICKEAKPYYFYIKDVERIAALRAEEAEKKAAQRATSIAMAAKRGARV